MKIDTALDYLHDYMDKNIMFNTPISDQWRSYTENIKNNVLLIDLDGNSATLCYSINSITKKVCGIMIQNPTLQILNLLISKMFYIF
jgi:hypothetical protein